MRSVISAVCAVISAVCAVILSPAAYADPGDQLDAMLESMPVVSRDSNVEIKSDAALQNVGALAAQFADAYNFDRTLLHLSSNQLLNKPVVIGLATEATLGKFMKSTTGGRAFGNDSFISHASFYSERPDFAWFVTAHELEHLQMHRLRAKEPDVPVYIFEGIACAVGDRYVLKKFGKCKYLNNTLTKLTACTGAEAADVVHNFRNSDSVASFKAQNKLWLGEHVGVLFIEFLQSRFREGQFFQLFGLICQDITGGISFKTAFKNRLGFTLEAAESEFLTHMTATENKPSARFERTVYAAL